MYTWFKLGELNRINLEDPGADGKFKIKTLLIYKRWKSMNWINLAQGRDICRGVV
jgi:hypothetical protein